MISSIPMVPETEATEAGRVVPTGLSSDDQAPAGLGPSGFDPSRSVADVLDAAADLLSRPGAWTQGTLYRTADGQPAFASEDDKSCFCAAGAICEVGGRNFDLAWDYLDRFLGKDGLGNATARWNDAPERTQDEVVAKLREAAQASRQEQQKDGAR